MTTNAPAERFQSTNGLLDFLFLFFASLISSRRYYLLGCLNARVLFVVCAKLSECVHPTITTEVDNDGNANSFDIFIH